MKLLRLALVLVVLSCSKDTGVDTAQQNEEDEETPTEIEDLSLKLNDISPWKALFDTEIPGGHQDKQLIWGFTENQTINNHVREVPVQGNQATAFRLKPGETYFFRLTSKYQNIVHYSNVVELTVPLAVPILDQALSIPNSIFEIFDRVVQTQDGGYVLAFKILAQGSPQNDKIGLVKYDQDFNLLWHEVVNQGINSDQLKGLIPTSDNAVLVLVNMSEPNNGPPYQQYRSYITKIDGNGSEEWTRFYQYKEGNDEIHYRNDFYEILEGSDPVRFTILADSTRYQSNDEFAWEATIDSDGNITNRYTIDHETSGRLTNLKFDSFGNKYSFGRFYGGPVFMDKYDLQGNLVWTSEFSDYFDMKSIGDYFVGEGYFAIASWIDNAVEHTNLVIKTDAQANPIWDYKVINDTLVDVPTNNLIFRAKRIREIANNELLALINDFEVTTLTDFDENGVVQWRYSIPEDADGYFVAEDFFVHGTIITLIGLKEHPVRRFWVKQYDLTEL